MLDPEDFNAYSAIAKRKVLYEYHAPNGERFTCTADTAEEARKLRKVWQSEKPERSSNG